MSSEICECGGKYLFHNKKNHLNTKLHKNFIEHISVPKSKIFCYRDDKLFKIYSSISDAVADLNVSYNSICNNISGLSNLCDGYNFRKVTKEDDKHTFRDPLA